MVSPLFETSSVLEPVSFLRDGRQIGPRVAAYDPKERTLYLEACADVRVGDLASLRGFLRRVVEAPQVWLGAGVLAVLAPEPAFPDRGVLERPTAPAGGRWDYATATYRPGTTQALWTGPCLVTSVDQGADATDVADQLVTVQSFTVETPVALVDIRPGDVFRATASGDPRLVNRPLVVTRIQADSSGSARTFRAVENQG